jgi:hypothetical protein
MWPVSQAKSIPYVSGPLYNWNISTKGYIMPNWVYNGLTIEGNPEQVKSLMKQMNKPFVYSITPVGDLSFDVKQTKYVNPIFSFHNIYSYLDHGVTDEQYHSQPPRKDSDTFADWMKFESNDWYNFNNREWGTKWDVAVSEDNKYPDTYMEESENGENYVVYYNFNTAWSRPIPALQKLSAQYPTLLFTLSYEEETGWGGEMELLRGEIISEAEWETKCRECDAIDTLEYCDNDCGQICSSCNYTDDLYVVAAEKCQTHMLLLPSKEKAEA